MTYGAATPSVAAKWVPLRDVYACVNAFALNLTVYSAGEARSWERGERSWWTGGGHPGMRRIGDCRTLPVHISTNGKAKW